jgi:hypothetical protein
MSVLWSVLAGIGTVLLFLLKGVGILLLVVLVKAGAALELEIAKAQKQWYVFDKHDCIGEYNMAATAAIEATRLANDNCAGVHILHLTEAEKDAYCSKGIDTLRGIICN